MDVAIFIIIFVITSYLITLAWQREQDSVDWKWLLIVCGMFLIIPAAIRSNSVGTDIRVYQYPLYRFATSSQNLTSYFVRVSVFDMEVLYTFMVYVIAKVFHSINVLFFIEECLIVYPIIYCIWNYRNKIEPGYALLAYEALFYFDSYNIVRQWMAIALGLVGFVKWDNRKCWQAVIFIVFSILFHKTAVIMVAVIFLYEIFRKIENTQLKFVLVASIVGGTIYFSLNYEEIMLFAIRAMRFLRERYGAFGYFRKEGGANLPVISIALWVIFLVVLVMIRLSETDYFMDWNILMIAFSLLSIPFLANADAAIRVMLYVQVFSIFAAGYCVRIVKENTGSRMIYASAYIFLLTMVWVYNNYIAGVGEVFPYHTFLAS